MVGRILDISSQGSVGITSQLQLYQSRDRENRAQFKFTGAHILHIVLTQVQNLCSLIDCDFSNYFVFNPQLQKYNNNNRGHK